MRNPNGNEPRMLPEAPREPMQRESKLGCPAIYRVSDGWVASRSCGDPVLSTWCRIDAVPDGVAVGCHRAEDVSLDFAGVLSKQTRGFHSFALAAPAVARPPIFFSNLHEACVGESSSGGCSTGECRGHNVYRTIVFLTCSDLSTLFRRSSFGFRSVAI